MTLIKLTKIFCSLCSHDFMVHQEKRCGDEQRERSMAREEGEERLAWDGKENTYERATLIAHDSNTK